MEESISVSSATTPEAEQAVNEQYGNETRTEINLQEGGTDSITVTSEQTAQPQQEPEVYKMPDKFSQAADPQAELLKAYINLEKTQGQPQAQPETPTEQQAGDSQAFDITKYHDLWSNQGGKLEDSQWAELQSTTGLPIDVLKKYETMYNQEAKSGVLTNDDKIYDLSGGKDKYDTMIEWANTSMSADQIQALNLQLDNPAFSEMGVKMLTSMYNSNVGFEAKTNVLDKSTTTNAADEADDFHSDADFQRAMKHKEYGEGGSYDQWFDRKAMKLMKKQHRK